MENMHSSLDRCLFLLPISIHAFFFNKKKKEIVEKIGIRII